MFRPHSRPFDPTAMSYQNLVLNEVRPLSVLDKYVFIPSHGPYYPETLVVRAGSRILVRETDYQCLVLYKEATIETAKEVAVVIRINDRTLEEVTIDYQAVGGKFQNLVSVLKSIKENAGGKLVNPIYWKDIIDKPTSFNPAAHLHSMWEFQGWEQLINSLDKIRQGIYFRKIGKYRQAYDYYYAKRAELLAGLDTRLAAVNTDIETLLGKLRDPIGYLQAYTTAQSSFPDGVWQSLPKNYLLYGVTVDADLGKEYGVSEEFVVPQPENILLDEAMKPIMQDENEWIYLDNEHPVIPLDIDSLYWEPIDEQFDARSVKFYKKTQHSPEYDATLIASPTTISDGQSTTFTLQTISFAPNLTIPYQITGVAQSNINQPITGELVTDQNGIANLTVTLIAGSPITNLDKMYLEASIMGGISAFCNYNLSSNNVPDMTTRLVQGMNNLTINQIIYGDIFSLVIDHAGIDGEVLKVGSNLPSGLAYTVNGVTAPTTGGRIVNVNIPADTNRTYIKIKSTAATGLPTLNNARFTLTTVENTVFTTEDFTSKPVTVVAWFIDAFTGATINEVEYGQQFKLKVQHDSLTARKIELVVVPNAISSYLENQPLAPIYTDSSGRGESGILRLTKPTSELNGTLNINVKDPFVASIFQTLGLNVVYGE